MFKLAAFLSQKVNSAEYKVFIAANNDKGQANLVPESLKTFLIKDYI